MQKLSEATGDMSWSFNLSGDAEESALGPIPQLMALYDLIDKAVAAFQLKIGLDPLSGTRLLPINTALRKAIQHVGLNATYAHRKSHRNDTAA